MMKPFYLVALLMLLSVQRCHAADRPNILWITSEDNGPELGCYGDKYADTPRIDQLAAMGMKYEYCWSSAPVCAPARTTIISGLFPPSLGAQHMRSYLPMPRGMKMYPQYLREAGYYCTNNSKEDYNLVKPEGVWDDSSRQAHWKNRKSGQPFFAIFNYTTSHESQLRKRPHTPVHDPTGVTLPAYHPDTPEVRQDWAQYYDKLTEMDRQVGKSIDELKQAGLLDNTIIFYYGDHGSGMPRHKRWPYNSGLHVPLVVYFPSKYQHLAPVEYKTGGSSERLVSFLDLAPTLLSLCDIEPPTEMQGKAFAGPHATEDPDYIYGFRGRMDERIDMVRSIRNERYIYIRHFQPHRQYGQFVHYMFQTPTTRKWYQLHLEGQLTPEQDLFWQTKPAEELYDLQADPDEVHNLVDDPNHLQILNQMRVALSDWMKDVQDLGIVPEAEMHRICGAQSPYDVQRDGGLISNYENSLMTAFIATSPLATPEKVTDEGITKAFNDASPINRYWACQWTLSQGTVAVNLAHDRLVEALQDESPNVRITAAEALGRFGDQEDLSLALPVLVEAADLTRSDVFSAIAAFNALDYLDDKAQSKLQEISALPEKVKQMPTRTNSYVMRLKQKTLADLKGEPLP